jgi:lysyl-tRNA synthetase class 2
MTWWTQKEWKQKRPNLLVRNKMRQAMADFFQRESFLEVETPALQRSPGLEPHLMAFSTIMEDHAGRELDRLYLHTSPEFAMKKLLTAGAGDIFQFARVYRNREGSRTHSPEFTMLEWYRVGVGYERIMDDTIALVRAATESAGALELSWQGLASQPFDEWERLSVRDAFLRYTGIDLLRSMGDGIQPNTVFFYEEVKALGLSPSQNDSWEDLFFRVFLEKIEPKLGSPVPTILYDYPACMAALACRKASDPRFAERFEVYVSGLELANAFTELTDPHEQRLRFLADMEKKQLLYGFSYPIDEDFLSALAQMPDAAGIALGFDRLVMLATGAKEINEVLFAPVSS